MIIKSLQDRKIMLLTIISYIKNKQKNYINKIYLDESIFIEQTIFLILQKILSISFFFTYFNYKNILYINLNTNKTFDFKIIIYYINKQIVDIKYLKYI